MNSLTPGSDGWPTDLPTPVGETRPLRGLIGTLSSFIPSRFRGRWCVEPEDALSAARQFWVHYRQHGEDFLQFLYATPATDAAGAPQSTVTETTALQRGCVWACVFASALVTRQYRSLLVLEARRQTDSNEGAVCALHAVTHEPRCWHLLAEIDLDGPEPDWDKLRGEREAP